MLRDIQDGNVLQKRYKRNRRILKQEDYSCTDTDFYLLQHKLKEDGAGSVCSKGILKSVQKQYIFGF